MLKEYDRHEERTGFQESNDYDERYDIQSDFVMVYGLHNLKNRIAHWKKRGYVIHLMTGIAWGNYGDYLSGKYDGREHYDEMQVGKGGKEAKNHGGSIPYMVPSVSFADYMANKLKVAIDAGVEAIHLEEPEFWVECGYSEAFKREWRIFYNEPWQNPHATCEGHYKASKLKQYLYKRTLDRICAELKEYSLVKYGKAVRFYVPTHSLINYSQWKIVSPESSLLDIPSVDGYIAQIWTGTSRVRNTYRGVSCERTFENAFLEYGIMQELVAGTDRKMWYLHDPIEDNLNHTWEDYRKNYYKTVAASLFHPEIASFEVTPWPKRVYTGQYPNAEGTGKEGIPKEYKTNLLTVNHALRDMKTDDVEWLTDTKKIGVILSDTCLFERSYPDGDRQHDETETVLWDPFFGLAMPLLKSGLCVRPVQLENFRRYPGYGDGYKKLVLSYEFMKPESPDINNAIAQWVRNGGALVYVGDGSDAYHDIPHWWNSGKHKYKTPADHLFETMGLSADISEGVYSVGKGTLTYYCASPSDIAKDTSCCDIYLSHIKNIFEMTGEPFSASSSFALRRGRYVVAAALYETCNNEPLTLAGTYIDIFDEKLPVCKSPEIKTGDVRLFADLSRIDTEGNSDIIAVSGRVSGVKQTNRSLTCKITGPSEMRGCIRVWTKRPPKTISAKTGSESVPVTSVFDKETKTTYIEFPSSPRGIIIKTVF